MGSFMDKVKASVKSGAEQAATKAQEEFDKMSVRKELGSAYEALGTKAYELAHRGERSHPELGDLVQHVRELHDKLSAIGTEQAAPAAEEPPPVPSEPAAEQQPPTT